jgi:hypothetical protein
MFFLRVPPSTDRNRDRQKLCKTDIEVGVVAAVDAVMAGGGAAAVAVADRTMSTRT